MGGYTEIDEWFVPSLVHEPRTILLMGQTGGGKSATGNSILGRAAFKSRMSPKGVTNTVDFQTTTLPNGEVVNIIDTPGLFDSGIGTEAIFQEIMNCVELARDGFHAVLLVYNLRGRFTEEDEGVIQSLKRLFGSKITDYIILVFTGGDDFDEDESLEGYLALGSKHLQNIVEICKNRCVLFDNKTKEAKKKASQLHKLLDIVDNLIEANGGQAYTDCLFADIKETNILQQTRLEVLSSKGLSNEELTVSIEQIRKSYDLQLMQLTQMVDKFVIDGQKKSEDINELKKCLAQAEQKAEKLVQDTRKQTEDEDGQLRQMMLQTNKMLEQHLEDEKEARLRAEKIARDAQKQSEVEINELKKSLAKAEQKAEKLVEDTRKETEGEARKLRQMMGETNKILQKQFDDERDARLKAEIIARDAQKQFMNEITELKKNVLQAEKAEEVANNRPVQSCLSRLPASSPSGCSAPPCPDSLPVRNKTRVWPVRPVRVKRTPI